MPMTGTAEDVELLVCTRCRRGEEVPEDDTRPGAALFDLLVSSDLPKGLRVRPVECLSNCSQGCSIALRGAGRWTYVYGNLHEASHLDVILDGASRYQRASDGIVPWRERPEHFRKNCIARVPPIEE
jgi:predicted metal-binding protein